MVLISTDYTTLLSVTKFTGGVLELPDSVKIIGVHAFKGCTDFSTIEIPETVTEIGPWAFAGCNYMTSIKIPNTVTKIGAWAFAGCYGLKSISIPSSVKEIGYGAFADCVGLEAIKLPDSLAEISDNTFSGCSNLTIAEISNVKKIGRYAFLGCMKLNSIQIPSSVKEIGDFAFYGCQELLKHEIPVTVTKTGKMMFGAIKDEDISHNWKFRKYVTNYTLRAINDLLLDAEKSYPDSIILRKRINFLKKYIDRNEIMTDQYAVYILNVISEIENLLYVNPPKNRALKMRINILLDEILGYGYAYRPLVGKKYKPEYEKEMDVSFLCKNKNDTESLFISEVQLPPINRYKDVIIQKGRIIVDSNKWWIRLYRKINSLFN